MKGEGNEKWLYYKINDEVYQKEAHRGNNELNGLSVIESVQKKSQYVLQAQETFW